MLGLISRSQIKNHLIGPKDAFQINLRVPQLIILHDLNNSLSADFFGPKSHWWWLVGIISADGAPNLRLRNERKPRGTRVETDIVDASV